MQNVNYFGEYSLLNILLVFWQSFMPFKISALKLRRKSEYTSVYIYNPSSYQSGLITNLNVQTQQGNSSWKT